MEILSRLELSPKLTDGRIVCTIPSHRADLSREADIIEEVVIAGANTYLEIWNKSSWEEEKNLSQQQAWQIIESMESS